MADTVLTIAQIEDLFRNLTVQVLGLNPDAPETQSRVRITWPKKGAPAWKIDDDVVFLMVTYDSDPITQQTEITYSSTDLLDMVERAMSYTRVIRVEWILHGPNSFNDADIIRSGLFLTSIIQQLAVDNIALIIDMPLPTRTPELYNGQWWDRSTLYARFNERVVRIQETPVLQSANVQVVKD